MPLYYVISVVQNCLKITKILFVAIMYGTVYHPTKISYRDRPNDSRTQENDIVKQ